MCQIWFVCVFALFVLCDFLLNVVKEVFWCVCVLFCLAGWFVYVRALISLFGSMWVMPKKCVLSVCALAVYCKSCVDVGEELVGFGVLVCKC